VAENKEVPDSNIGVLPVRKYANYRTLPVSLKSDSKFIKSSNICMQFLLAVFHIFSVVQYSLYHG
jgi:hypothetical protein